MKLFHDKEIEYNAQVIFPVYCGITKETVFKQVPWLKDIAFEKIEDPFACSPFEREKILCRLINKFLQQFNTYSNINKLNNLNLPDKYSNLKKLLDAICQTKYFYSENIQLSCLELCNIESILLIIIEDLGKIDTLLLIIKNYIKHIKKLIFNMPQVLDNDHFITICKSVDYTSWLITKL